MKKTVFSLTLAFIGTCVALNGFAQNDKVSASGPVTTKQATSSSRQSTNYRGNGDCVRLFNDKQLTPERMIDHPLGFLSSNSSSFTYEQALQEVKQCGAIASTIFEGRTIAFSPWLDDCNYDLKWNGYEPFDASCVWVDGKMTSYLYTFSLDIDRPQLINYAEGIVKSISVSKGIKFKDDPENVFRSTNALFFRTGKYGTKDICIDLSIGVISGRASLEIRINDFAKHQNAVTNGDVAAETSSENLLAENQKPETSSLGVASKGANSSNPLERYTVSHEGMYGKKRIGTFYYLSDQYVVKLIFKEEKGIYTLDDPIIGMLDPYSVMNSVTYELAEITDTDFIFYPYHYEVAIPSYSEMQSMIAKTGRVDVGKKKTRQKGIITVSKDWSQVNVNGTILKNEMTTEFYDLVVKYNEDLRIKGIAAGIIKLDMNDQSELEQQLKAEIEESQRKIDGINNKSISTYEKRNEMNRGHTVIRYKSTNVPSTPTVWCPVCNRYDKPHDHVLNDGKH